MKASELFEKILDNPGIYVGKPSLPLIYSYIDGYCVGKLESGEEVRDNLYAGFSVWVAKRFNIKTAHNWSDILVFMGRSEAVAFECAKQYWREYTEFIGVTPTFLNDPPPPASSKKTSIYPCQKCSCESFSEAHMGDLKCVCGHYMNEH